MHFCFIFRMFAFQSIHGSHFSCHFWLHFSVHSNHSSAKQPKVIQKWLLWTTLFGQYTNKNEVKNDVKNGYCEHPGKHKCILHGPQQCWQVLCTFKLHLKGPHEIFIVSSSPKWAHCWQSVKTYWALNYVLHKNKCILHTIYLPVELAPTVHSRR